MKNKSLKSVAYPLIATFLLLLFGGYSVINKEDISFGGTSMQPSGIDKTIREDLVSGSSRTQTTLNVDSLTTREGHQLTMSDFNAGYGYAVIDNGRSNVELIRFTGMTDNSTYYTLTGVEWGCNSYNTTCDVDANKKRHNSGASFSITTDFHFVSENFVDVTNDQTISGVKTWDVYPEINSSLGYATTSWQFVTKNYADAIANQGAATSTETVAGIAELATQVEMASSTPWTTINPHIIQSQYATSTPSASDHGLYVVVSENDGYINQGWLDLSDDYTWTGSHIFSNQMIITNDVYTNYGNPSHSFNIGWSTSLTNSTSTLNITDPNGDDALYVTGNATTTGSMDINELCFDGANCTSGIKSITGSATNQSETVSTGSATDDQVITVGFKPSTIIINGVALDGNASSARRSFGTMYYNSSGTFTGGFQYTDEDEDTSDAFDINNFSSTGGIVCESRSDLTDRLKVSLTVVNITDTGFTIRVTYTKTAGSNSITGSVTGISYTAIR